MPEDVEKVRDMVEQVRGEGDGQDARPWVYSLTGTRGEDFVSGDKRTRGEAVAAALKEIADEELLVGTIYLGRGEMYMDGDKEKHRVVDIEVVKVPQVKAGAAE
jgi:hypothetical protein